MTSELEATLQALGARIDALEMKVTYQDEVIETLNTVIVDQWSKFDAMRAQIARLESRMREVQSHAGQDGHEEPPPPHY